jgi:hypothetical protein
MGRHQGGKNFADEVVNRKITHGDEIDIPPGPFMYEFQDFMGGDPGGTIEGRGNGVSKTAFPAYTSDIQDRTAAPVPLPPAFSIISS